MKLGCREVDRLLTGMVDPNCLSRQGTTPLVEAAKFGHYAVAENLLDSGADPNKANEHGSTPIYWAARRGHRATVELLLQGSYSAEEFGFGFDLGNLLEIPLQRFSSARSLGLTD